MDERRRLRRHRARLAVSYQTSTVRAAGYVKNVNQGGLFIRAAELPAPGQLVRLTIEVPDEHKLHLDGVVRWTTAQLREEDGSPGFGVYFATASPEYLDLFEKILIS